MRILIATFLCMSAPVFAAELSITIDDPHTRISPLMSAAERDKKILAVLKSHKIQAALFVCGMRINNPQGKKLLRAWDKAGHLIANHSYSHFYFPSTKITLAQFQEDISKNDRIISGYKNYSKLLRFPYLKEGDTREKRDGMREYLKANHYKQGYVSIDASDWYVTQRLEERLLHNPKADISGFKDFYLTHMWERARYYNDLSKKALGREVKHTLLIHHNLLNALFLDDLIQMFKAKGWKIIDAKDAYQDPVYTIEPDILPAGESIVWAIAHQTGKFAHLIRYPADDSQYEKEKMDKLGL